MSGTTVSQDTNWRLNAPCADPSLHPDTFFELAEEDRDVEKMCVEICMNCPVMETCLEAALVQQEEFGIFGGMTPKQRNSYRKQWLRKAKEAGDDAKTIRERHGVLRRDTGVERSYMRRTQKAKAVMELVKASSSSRREDYIMVIDTIIANPKTNMTALAGRFGKSRSWFEGVFRDACKEFGVVA